MEWKRDARKKNGTEKIKKKSRMVLKYIKQGLVNSPFLFFFLEEKTVCGNIGKRSGREMKELPNLFVPLFLPSCPLKVSL